MSEAADFWYIRLPDGQVLRAASTAIVRQHLEAGRIPAGSMVRRTADGEWVTLAWTREFADLAGKEPADGAAEGLTSDALAPPGVAEGGVLEVLVHDLKVTCRANAIPDSIRVDVSQLHLDQEIKVKDLTLPEGVTVDADPELLLVHVSSHVTAAPEAAAAEGEGPSQPEVIKPERKEKEE